jgi:hypothetical protein
MSLDLVSLTDQLASYAGSSGYFDRVNTHEPKSAPGNGMTAALWLDSFEPARGQSALDSTTLRVVFVLRPYLSMLTEPQDGIDARIVAAINALVNSISGDFDLGGNVRCVDLLGLAGIPLSAQAGYLDQDGKKYRTLELTIPLLVNDVWTQVA